MTTVLRSRTTRRTSAGSPSVAMRLFAHVGLTARGVIYLLLGWVAVLVAVGKTTDEADQRGALQLLAGTTYGRVALWLIAAGLACYALWRLSETVFGVPGDSGTGARFTSLCRALAYGALTATTISVVRGDRKSQSSSQQELTARIMHHSGGRLAVGVVGIVVAAVGLTLVVEGLRRSFVKYLRTNEMAPSTRRIVVRFGVVGTVARGLVFALAGGLVVDAAVRYQPSKAGGLDTALRTLRDHSYGKVLLLITAAGLLVFGIYGLCEARWRKA